MGEVDRSRLGSEAEERCVAWLERAGYCIRERNWLAREGELDIVAERNEVLCFVEVRMRSTAVWGDPSHTVSFSKQRRVVKAALHYLFAYDLREKMMRFDVVSVVGHGEKATVEHIPNAFDAGM